MKLLLLLAVGVVVAWGSVSAQAPPKAYGVGGQPCLPWVTVPPARTVPTPTDALGLDLSGLAGMEASFKSVVALAWATGYVSGAGATLAGTPLRATSGKDIEAWLTTYCTAHPEATMAAATAALVKHLRS